MLDRLLWAVVGWLPAAPWADWLAVPVGDDRIGPGWPARRATALGTTLRADPDGGLLPEVSALPGADRIHPRVLDFYAHTARYALEVEPRWWPGLRIAGRIWARLFARRWGQLELPMAAGEPLSNEIFVSGAPDPCRWWVRRYADGRTLYVSHYQIVDVDSEPEACVRIAFPVPGGAWVVLFRVACDGDALVLTEAGGRAGGPGLYLVRADGRAFYVRAFREEIRVAPDGDGSRAVHRFWLFGLPFLSLGYVLSDRGTA